MATSTKPAPVEIRAYCMKTKEKNVLMQNAVITQTSKGGLFAKGDDGKGNILCSAIGKEKAEAAIKAGVAKKAY